MSAKAKARQVAKASSPTIGNRLAPPRFLIFLALFPLFAFLADRIGWGRDWRDSVAIAFDAAAWLFLVSLWPVLRASQPDEIRHHASENDANRFLVLLITSAVTVVVMATITGELAIAKSGSVVGMVKLIGTLATIWLFANVVYAVHYAHVYYSTDAENGGDRGGLEFPATKNPGYWDFAYFSMTLGMTFQTSDVSVTAARIRRVVLLQSLAAFVFNIGVIAFSINALGGGA